MMWNLLFADTFSAVVDSAVAVALLPLRKRDLDSGNGNGKSTNALRPGRSLRTRQSPNHDSTYHTQARRWVSSGRVFAFGVWRLELRGKTKHQGIHLPCWI